MSRGPQTNPPGKRALVEALFRLMSQKDFSDITITELIRDAKVARATFYRNFYTKEDIVKYFLDLLQKELLAQIPEAKKQMVNLENVFEPKIMAKILELSFSYALKNKFYLVTLYKSGLGDVAQKTLNVFAMNIAVEQNSEIYYRLLFLQGASYNLLMQWLVNGANESPYYMAHKLVTYLERGIIKK
ncbi:TetR/AcrR family transcriptional regulator [Weissella paramesenteroides]|uniref:TetR/AcrR family transcriptional regulator n=1 Tax=Weissella paramesenteroides TaxID=1249 RepID=UPI002E7C44F9|nr:TetR/AcrR family transcriptional regulator [Weissella paramesenteroides]WPQ68875.1 TetR/AcrR family transcriptional regulator [Weissella paramesenteroides]